MKILMIFIDMLRPNIFGIYNEAVRDNQVDEEIRKIGGTIFTECYTPAPDTPRSNACLWTSRYPKDNGCDNRLKYPFFYLNKDVDDLFGVLKEHGYSFNFFIHPISREMGELPCSVKDYGNYSNGRLLEEYVSDLVIEDNSLTYFCLEDFHRVITSCHAQKKYLPFAFEKVAGNLRTIQNGLNMDQFDLTFIFSDHGLKFREQEWFENCYLHMDEDRTRIFMLVKKKNERELRYNHKLCSIMDVFPTVMDFLNIDEKHEVEGHSLLKSDEYDMIFIEDHKHFGYDLGQPIEYWAIRSSKGYSCVDNYLNWKADHFLSEDEKERYIGLLEQKASSFKESIRLTKIQEGMNNFDFNNCYYDDGSLRVEHDPIEDKIRRTFEIIKKNLKRTRNAIFRKNDRNNIH